MSFSNSMDFLEYCICFIVENFCASDKAQGTERDNSPSDALHAIGMTAVKFPKLGSLLGGNTHDLPTHTHTHTGMHIITNLHTKHYL